MDAIEQLFVDLAFGPALEEPAQESFLLRLQALPLGAKDIAFLGAQGVERLLVYRRLLRGNLREAIQATMPRTLARLEQRFDDYFDRFLQERPPSTHYLRDVCREFLDFCAPLWAKDPEIPGYLRQLGEHEVVRIEVASEQARLGPNDDAELALERGIRFVDAARIRHYEYAIHELSDDAADRRPPAREDTWLLTYRSPEHEVRYLKLTPLAAAILAELMEKQAALGQAVTTAAHALGIPLTEQVLTGTAEVLADLGERGVVLGPR